MATWLIGESNPYQTEPRPEYDLYPNPPQSAGARLCRILGYDPKDPDPYLAAFERRNLLYGQDWSPPQARVAASQLVERLLSGDALVLLGAKVAVAFGMDYQAHFLCEGLTLRHGARATAHTRPLRVLVIPHPSGLSRGWDDRTVAPRVRAAVAALRGQ